MIHELSVYFFLCANSSTRSHVPNGERAIDFYGVVATVVRGTKKRAYSATSNDAITCGIAYQKDRRT